jgi:hypothetical protein
MVMYNHTSRGVFFSSSYYGPFGIPLVRTYQKQNGVDEILFDNHMTQKSDFLCGHQVTHVN